MSVYCCEPLSLRQVVTVAMRKKNPGLRLGETGSCIKIGSGWGLDVLKV